MKITIITVGKKHDKSINSLILEFEKRLRAPFKIDWCFLPNSNFTEDKARIEESERILKTIKSDDFLLLLDERGKNITSPALSRMLSENFIQSKNIVIVIGGAFGVSDALRNRANFMWSLSKLVFPHQIVRLIVVEQIYRAQEIASGGKYHHE